MKEDGAAMSAMVKLPQSLDNLFVRIENEAGQLLRTFEVGAKPAGDSKVKWDGKDEDGNPLPAGKYTVYGTVGGLQTKKPVTLSGQATRRIKLRLK